MIYPIRQLSELCDIVIGRTPARKEPEYWGKGNKWVSISDLTSKEICDTKEEITDYAVKKTRCRLVPKGTLLFSFKLTIGKMAFAGCDLYTNEAIAALHIKNREELYSEYLFFALSVAKLLGSNQAAMGKTLNSKSLAKIEIPLPPLDDQKCIAHLLGKVEGLIARRKHHLQQLDVLLKSVFLEMFGDAEQWPTVSMNSLALTGKGTFSNGPFGSNLLTSELTNEGVPVIYIRDIRDAVYKRVSTVCVTPEKASELHACHTSPGDVLIAKVGDPPGISAVYPEGEPLGIITQDVIRIKVNLDMATPAFISAFLNSHHGQRMLRGITVSGTRSRFGLRNLKEQVIPLPPLDLQSRFGFIAKKIDTIKDRYQQSLMNLESLYGTLSQKAFKGELDLSRVALPDEQQDAMAEEYLSQEIQEDYPALGSLELSTPDIEALLDLATPEGRKPTIEQWLTECIEQMRVGESFSAQQFMEKALNKMIELDHDGLFEDWGREGEPKVTVADYDNLKDMIFKLVENGTLIQAFATGINSLQVAPA